MEIYDWQKEIIEHNGDCTIRGGRQTGKSFAVARRILKLAEEYPGSRHLVIASSERQEGFLAEKVHDLLGAKYKFRKRKLKSHIPMKNGTDIFIFPVGVTGIFVEGLSSIDFLHADEAIHIKKRVWDSILPMLAEPRSRGLGWITLLSSTQRSKPSGLFFDSFKMKHFKKFHIKAKDCPHISAKFLKEELERMGEEKFDIVYNATWDFKSAFYFPHDLIDKQATIKFWTMKELDPKKKYFLGIDPARFGKSKAAFASSEWDGKKMRIIHIETIKKSSMIELKNKAIEFDEKLKYKMLYVDDGGVGGGLIDILEEKFKRRLTPMNNKSLGREFKILKEDLYSNFLKLLEEGKLELLKDKELIEALKKVEFNEDKIIGTDLSEAAVRAAWGAKEKKYKLTAV